jgi:hypothetical protein
MFPDWPRSGGNLSVERRRKTLLNSVRSDRAKSRHILSKQPKVIPSVSSRMAIIQSQKSWRLPSARSKITGMGDATEILSALAK